MKGVDTFPRSFARATLSSKAGGISGVAFLQIPNEASLGERHILGCDDILALGYLCRVPTAVLMPLLLVIGLGCTLPLVIISAC